jgi:hypothetical protein
MEGRVGGNYTAQLTERFTRWMLLIEGTFCLSRVMSLGYLYRLLLINGRYSRSEQRGSVVG